MFKKLNEKAIPKPQPLGSYSQQDVVFLLKDIAHLIEEKGNEEREAAIQSGIHYSEMLPIEYKPSKQYMQMFYDSLEKYDKRVAIATGVVAEMIINKRGRNIVLVSLARAGTPVGILIKRYLAYKYDIDIPHYSISIIRGKGIDENAIRYILLQHPDLQIQFVDGWTGKGAITNELQQACEKFAAKWGVRLNDDLAVLADPGHCVRTFGTREDFLIPSACLNSTVSGLVSRTVHREDLIKENDFHGVKFYRELMDVDVSGLFIDTISAQFSFVINAINEQVSHLLATSNEPLWLGMKDVVRLQQTFQISNIHFIKPGIGETTRVLLRRIPWKIIVNGNMEHLQHIFQLAKERGIPVETYPLLAYHSCGLVKSLKGE